jgi:hypothetical protein
LARLKARLKLHWLAPGICAKAAQAWGEATMRSWPNLFSGEVAGRKTRGVGSVTLRAAGKAMTEDCATVLLTLVVELQVREVIMGCRGPAGGGCAEHCPAVSAVVLALPQHWQEVQPTVSRPPELQQQPP